MTVKGFFSQDKPIVGVAAALLSEAGCAALLWLCLLVAGWSVTEHLRWFAACIVPPLLLLRHYAKKHKQLRVTKSIIVVVFVTFVAFMWLLFKYHYLGEPAILE